MKGIAYLAATVVALASTLAYMAHAEQSGAAPTPVFDIQLPSGYRDWRVISVAHEAGNNNDLRAILVG